MGGKDRRISEIKDSLLYIVIFKASLLYRVTSRSPNKVKQDFIFKKVCGGEGKEGEKDHFLATHSRGLSSAFGSPLSSPYEAVVSS